MTQINYEEIISQLKSDLNAECAIANKYGIILGSLIKEFAKGKGAWAFGRADYQGFPVWSYC